MISQRAGSCSFDSTSFLFPEASVRYLLPNILCLLDCRQYRLQHNTSIGLNMLSKSAQPKKHRRIWKATRCLIGGAQRRATTGPQPKGCTRGVWRQAHAAAAANHPRVAARRCNCNWGAPPGCAHPAPRPPMPPPPATPLCLAGGDLRVVRPKSPRPFSTSILLPHCPAFEPPPLPVPTTTRLETSSTTDLPMAAPRNSLPPPGTLALRFLTRTLSRR